MFDKHRFEIWTPAQHPLKHTLSDFAYTNPALPGVTTVDSALNWVFKVLYPRTQPSVANPAALPSVGNTLNDYRVVLDDGDGKQAGYRWEQREGDVAAKWYKIYDFDWSTDSILAAFLDVTQDMYVWKAGRTDLDDTGVPITGIYAGQTINGGNAANQNLTLRANSGDGVGAHTGFVQVDDNFRATVTGTYDLGTTGIRFKDLYLSGSALISTMTIATGSITDSSGTISFGDENLITTGNISGAIVTGSTSLVTGTMTITGGSITDSSGAISFGNENLTTTGTVTGAANSVFGDITLGTGAITSASPAISFGSNNLITTGTLGAGDSTFTRVDADNLRLDGNTISSTNTNGNLNLAANGTGVIDLQSAATTLGLGVTGNITIAGQIDNGSLIISTNAIQATQTNSDLYLGANGTGRIQTASQLEPTTDDAHDLGRAAKRYQDLFLSGEISDGTTAISQATLQSLRDINAGVAVGMSIFWDGAKWAASAPDTEITHADIGGLTTGDAGHTQFVMLAGRVGGQTIQGGTAPSEHLNLESTSNATKGLVKTKDNFVPFTDSSYSGGWSGIDLGSTSLNFNNVFTKGEFKGFRFENYTTGTLPAASGQNVGRAVWATDVNKIYVDVGGSWQIAGSGKFLSDTVWNGAQVQQTFTVSASIVDARNAIWALHDNTNNFERIFCKIEAISATQVRVTVAPALDAGSYRLIGIE